MFDLTQAVRALHGLQPIPSVPSIQSVPSVPSVPSIQSVVVSEGIQPDIAADCAALLRTPSGTLIAANILHAPPDVLALLSVRDAYYNDCGTGNDVECLYTKVKQVDRTGLKNYPRQTTLRNRLRTGLTAIAVLPVGLGFMSDTVATHWLLTLVGTVGSLTVSMGLIHRWRTRDPLRLTETQVTKLLTHVADGGWSVKNVEEITNNSKTPLGKDVSQAKGASLSASGMVIMARTIINDIRSFPSWNNPILDVHPVRLDLDRELAEITAASLALWQMRANEPTWHPLDGSSLGHSADKWEQEHAALHASIVDRLSALKRYRERLASVGAMLTEQEDRRQVSQGTNILTHVDLGAAALTDLNKMTTELGDLEAGIVAQNQFLASP